MSFKPSDRWYRNWPWKQSTIVRLQATLKGDRATVVGKGFLATLTRGESGSYYSGGYGVREAFPDEGYSLEIYSAGEDGFDSALYGVEDLENYLTDHPEIAVTWQELEPTKSRL